MGRQARIKEIQALATAPYYDFTVPVFGNYWACGFWHHNSGKSSLVEAVPLALWNETLRGKDPMVVPGAVEVVTDQVHAIRSTTGKKKRLEWQPGPGCGGAFVEYATATKAQEALEQVVGSFSTWRRTCVFSSQDAAHFSLATDAERKRLIEGLLGLARFDVALDACRADRKVAEAALATARSEASQHEVRLVAARERVADAERVWAAAPPEAVAEDLRARAAKLVTLAEAAEAELSGAQVEVRELERKVDGFASAAAEAERRGDALEAEKRALVKRLAGRQELEGRAARAEALRGEQTTLAVELDALRREREQHQAEVARWRVRAVEERTVLAAASREVERAEAQASGLAGVPCGGEGEFSACPLIANSAQARDRLPGLREAAAKAVEADRACGAEPQPRGVLATLVGKEARWRDLSGLLAETAGAAEALAGLREVDGRAKVIDAEAVAAAQAAKEAHKGAAAAGKLLDAQGPAVDELAAEAGALRAKRADTAAALRAADDNAKRRQVALDGLKRASAGRAAAEEQAAGAAVVAEARERQAALLLTVEQVLGTKGVRAHVLGQALSGLEAAANGWLARISGGELALALRPYVEKKTGGVSDAIGLEVQGAGGGEYKGASGGQRRLVDVALILGLAEVAQAASGSGGEGSTIFLDEVMDSLDDEHVGLVSEVLEDMARDRCVVVISHSPAVCSALTPDEKWVVAGGRVERS